MNFLISRNLSRFCGWKVLLLNFRDLRYHCCESLIEYHDFKRSWAVFIYILIAYHNTHRQSISSVYLHKHTILLRQARNLISNNVDIILLLGFHYFDLISTVRYFPRQAKILFRTDFRLGQKYGHWSKDRLNASLYLVIWSEYFVYIILRRWFLMKGGKNCVMHIYIGQKVRELVLWKIPLLSWVFPWFLGSSVRCNMYTLISHNEGDRQIQQKAEDVVGTLHHLSFYHWNSGRQTCYQLISLSQAWHLSRM